MSYKQTIVMPPSKFGKGGACRASGPYLAGNFVVTGEPSRVWLIVAIYGLQPGDVVEWDVSRSDGGAFIVEDYGATVAAYNSECGNYSVSFRCTLNNSSLGRLDVNVSC